MDEASAHQFGKRVHRIDVAAILAVIDLVSDRFLGVRRLVREFVFLADGLDHKAFDVPALVADDDDDNSGDESNDREHDGNPSIERPHHASATVAG
nr:hypothetical protein [Bradyrhizobium paxllaeri]